MRMCFGRWLAALLVGSVVWSVSPVAFGQESIAQLRRENEALRQRIDQLEAQLTSSQQTVDRLRREVERLGDLVTSLESELRNRLPERPSGEGDGEGGGGEQGRAYAEVPEGAPLSSPAALLAELERTYEEATAELGRDSGRDRAQYLGAVTRWARVSSRELRGQAEWLIEVTDVFEREGGGVELEFRVLDEETLLPYSERLWSIELRGGSLLKRFEAHLDHELWRLGGRVSARPEVNPEREDVGFFDVPPFIGPFAEFGYVFEPDLLIRMQRTEEGEASGGGGDAASG